MDTIAIIAVAFVCAIVVVGLVTAIVALRDAVKAKHARETMETAAAAEKPAAEEEVAATVEESKPEADVNFSTDKLTLEEKYLKLPTELRAYYDEIVRYAMSIEGHKRYKSANYEEYKVGKNRIVRIRIKNDVITCELVVPNLDFRNYVSDNKIDVRQAATVIKVVDGASLEAVKGCMNIVLNEIEKEREYKKEQAKARRRERRAGTRTASALVKKTEAAETEEDNAEAEENAEEVAIEVPSETPETVTETAEATEKNTEAAVETVEATEENTEAATEVNETTEKTEVTAENAENEIEE